MRRNFTFKRIFALLALLALGSFAYAWGLATGNWKLFPFDELRAAYHLLKPEPPLLKPEPPVSPLSPEYRPGLFAAVPSQLPDASELEKARQDLRGFLVPTISVRSEPIAAPDAALEFLGETLVANDRVTAEQLFASAELSIISGGFQSIRDWRWRSLFLETGGDRLLIVHRGHASNPFEGPMVSRAIAEGFDVLAMTMPMVDWNEMENVVVDTWDGQSRWLGLRDHGALEMLDTGDKHFIGFFVSPVLSSLDIALAAKQYRSVAMVGLSGGGWMTAVTAAADRRISTAIAVAGTLPFFARQQAKDVGDAEQFDHAFYRRFPWPLLYQMAGSNQRRFVLIYNSQDPCCFDGASARLLREYLQTMAKIGLNAGYSMEVVDGDQHTFDPDSVFSLLNER